MFSPPALRHDQTSIYGMVRGDRMSGVHGSNVTYHRRWRRKNDAVGANKARTSAIAGLFGVRRWRWVALLCVTAAFASLFGADQTRME